MKKLFTGLCLAFLLFSCKEKEGKNEDTDLRRIQFKDVQIANYPDEQIFVLSVMPDMVSEILNEAIREELVARGAVLTTSGPIIKGQYVFLTNGAVDEWHVKKEDYVRLQVTLYLENVKYTKFDCADSAIRHPIPDFCQPKGNEICSWTAQFAASVASEMAQKFGECFLFSLNHRGSR